MVDEKSNNKLASLRRVTHVVYLCQALSFFTALSGIVGIIINYIKRDEVKGTWLESHFTWQIRTFWIGLALYALGVILLLGAIGVLVIPMVAIWNIYRIIRGWLLLNDEKPIVIREQCVACMRCRID